VVNTPSTYSGGRGLKFGLGDWLCSSFFVAFLSYPGNCWDITLNYATTASFHILSDSLFNYHPFTRRYIVWVQKKRRQTTNESTLSLHIYEYILHTHQGCFVFGPYGTTPLPAKFLIRHGVAGCPVIGDSCSVQVSDTRRYVSSLYSRTVHLHLLH